MKTYVWHMVLVKSINLFHPLGISKTDPYSCLLETVLLLRKSKRQQPRRCWKSKKKRSNIDSETCRSWTKFLNWKMMSWGSIECQARPCITWRWSENKNLWTVSATMISVIFEEVNEKDITSVPGSISLVFRKLCRVNSPYSNSLKLGRCKKIIQTQLLDYLTNPSKKWKQQALI